MRSPIIPVVFTCREQSDSAQGVPSKTVGVVSPSDNNSTNYSNNILINFNFVIENGKLASKTRYRYESQVHWHFVMYRVSVMLWSILQLRETTCMLFQILAKVSSTLSWLPKKSIDVIAVELSAPVLKCVVAFLEVKSRKKKNFFFWSIIFKNNKRNVFDVSMYM